LLAVVVGLLAISIAPWCLMAGSTGNTKADGYADKIVGRPNTDPDVKDQDNDGKVDVRDLVIYIGGLPAVAFFADDQSVAYSYEGTHNIQILFDRPVTGTYAYEIGGNALSNKDYQPLAGQLQLNNSTSVQLPIQILMQNTLRAPRSVVLSLKRPGTNVVSRINANPTEGDASGQRFSSHVVTIRDADQGYYQGNLSFLSQTTRTIQGGQTNVTIVPAPVVSPSNFFMALRSQGQSRVVMQMPECILFTTNLVAATASLVSSNQGFSGAAPVTGVTPLAGLGNRPVAWKFEFTSVVFSNQATLMDAECRITVNGLTAGADPLVLDGVISATRIDP
jgi:hypothetical protein